VPLVSGVGAQNRSYLETKRDRMGHDLPGDLTELEGHPS
jgi:3,4-dihydroxy 2-butanone 4-phosphate synthase / GTP cyclohydrolase II